MIELIKYLPQNHQGNNVHKLMELTDEQMQSARDFSVSIGLQASADLATYSLVEWEELLAIESDPLADNERRREIIKSKLRSRGQTTKEMIKVAAEAFSDGEVAIIEFPKEYRFIINFVGVKGIPKNMDKFIEMLEQIKPAHLAYIFEYTYTVWNDIKNKVWNDLTTETWEELRVY